MIVRLRAAAHVALASLLMLGGIEACGPSEEAKPRDRDAGDTGDASNPGEGPDAGDGAPEAGPSRGEDGGPPSGDASETDGGDTGTGAGAPIDGFLIEGRVTYDRVDAVADENGVSGLDYGRTHPLPVRRVLVEAVEGRAGTPLAEAQTNDDGRYRLRIPKGHTVRLRVPAVTRAHAYAPDGLAPDVCSGASWEARVVDNTQHEALYVLEDSRTFSGATTGVDLHAALTFQGRYRSRAAAPFALLDTFVTELELVCQGDPAPSLERLSIEWSVNNVPEGDDLPHGKLGSSFFTSDDGANKLYIVGQEDVDTDEYDAHIVAHELGHFLEEQLYRSDATGGDHGDLETLDPADAFGEGFGNAISGMVFDDPVYVDTYGRRQGEAFVIPVDAPPEGDDRGVYSERSAQYFLWSLYDRRDPTPGRGSYARIHAALLRHRTTEGVTCLQTFAAYYNALFGGGADGLFELWEDGLGTPRDALCAGPCSGANDAADPFDVDGDIGREYAGERRGSTARRYPQSSGQTYTADFWELYRPLSPGLNPATGHDMTRFGSYDDPENKLGAVRWYRVAGTGGPVTVSVRNLTGAHCHDDVLDMSVLDRGAVIGADEGAGGCPSVTFSTTAGVNYVVRVFGFETELSSWQMEVAP